MFAWLRPKPTLLNQIIRTVYGNSPPKRTANVDAAAQLAHALLGGLIGEGDVREVAKELRKSPLPFSTHDLALSIALNFFRRPEQIDRLGSVQLQARRIAAEWAKDPQKRIPPLMFQSFENCVRKRYQSTQPTKKQIPEGVRLLHAIFGLDEHLRPIDNKDHRRDDDEDKDDQFWVDTYREWASDRGIVLTERTTDELIVRVNELVSKHFRPMPEKGIKEISLNTYGLIVLQLLLTNENRGTDFMMEHLQYQIDYYRQNGLRPEHAEGLPFPASWNEAPQSE